MSDRSSRVLSSSDRVRPLAAIPAPVLPRRGRLGRRDVLLALLCLAVGVVSVAWLVNRGQERVEVMVVARPVARGEVVAADDLVPVRVALSGSIAGATPADATARIVGRVAAVDLVKGTVVNEALVSSSAVPTGKVLVGLLLKPGALPSARVRSGDVVAVVNTTSTANAASTSGAVVLVPHADVFAVTSAVRGATTEELFVSLLVDEASGPVVANAGAAGTVRLLGLPAGGS